MATDVARLALQIDVTGAQRAKQALAGLQDGSIKATRATNQLVSSTTRLSNVTRGAGSNFRFMRGSVQQVGFQIGDFATQVSSGQSAIVAFGQQASQLAGIMGPGGALLGAVIAIGAGIAGAFARSMMTGTEATGDMLEKTKELVEEMGRATELQRQFINTGFQQEILAQKNSVEDAKETIEEMNARLEDFRRAAGDNVPDAVFNSNNAVKSLKQNIEDARLVIDNATLSTDKIAKKQKEFWEAVEESGEKTKDTTDKIREMVQAAEQQAATIGLSARATATYEAALAGANAEQILAIDQAYQRIEAEQAKQEALKESERREIATRKALMASTKIGVEDDPLLQRIEAEKRGQQILLQQQKDYATARQSLDQQIISSAASTAGGLANVIGQLAGEQSNAYRAAFLAQQGFAIASAVVNTQLAAAAALAPPPIGLGPVAGLPYAGTIEALGAANVAIIAGQTVAGLASTYTGGGDTESFLGGGFTGTGTRSGGIDGKGGFPAILHPNETVIDHEMGQRARGGYSNQETNITQVLQVPGNIQQEVKQQIMAALPLIRSTAVQAVSTEINRGGKMARQVGRRS